MFRANVGRVVAAVERHAELMPVAAFTTSPLWQEARWTATTFRWHPTSAAPPVMGLVFENAEPGLDLFRQLEKAYNHTDRFEEMRVSVIEGSPAGQRAGYTVHICPDPDALAMHATGDGLVIDPTLTPFLGRWNRMYPVPGQPALLPRFKEEVRRHGEYLLAPVTRRADGQLWFSSELGFIKHTIDFREVADIGEGDIDAGAVLMPVLMPPRDESSGVTGG